MYRSNDNCLSPRPEFNTATMDARPHHSCVICGIAKNTYPQYVYINIHIDDLVEVCRWAEGEGEDLLLTYNSLPALLSSEGHLGLFG